jgi:hypothetical protein
MTKQKEEKQEFILEFTKDWVFTEAIFLDSERPDYELLGMDKPKEGEEAYEIFQPFRFRLKKLVAYNGADDESITVVRLSNDENFNINVPFEEFDKNIRRIMTNKVMGNRQ